MSPCSLGGQSPAVQSYTAALRDTQLRLRLQEMVGFIKGPERQGHHLLLRTEDSCWAGPLGPHSPTAQAFSLMPLGMGA